MAAIDLESPAGYLAFGDALFRKQRKHGAWQIMEAPAPALEGPVADTHAHLVLLSNPALSLARCSVQGVDFVCTITDAVEDGWATYRELDAWRSEALRILPDVFEATRRAMAAYREEAAAAGAPLPTDMTVDEWRAYRCPCAEVPIPHVRIATGVHPHVASRWDAQVEARLRAMLADPRTAALGEVGLDYHYDLSPRDVQRDVFRRQVVIAHECGLPLVLHMRDAHDDGFAILEEEGWPQAGVLLHCCSVGPDELRRWLDRGCYVAFGGAVTFARSDELRDSVRIVSEDRLLTETDAPYMAPVPFRGIECGPEFTLYTAQRIAQERGVEPGAGRAALLESMHAAALGLLDREPTAWQRAHESAAAEAMRIDSEQFEEA
ncbi:TatD family hydrolase [uncultured Slackia sp.]|uniref:TatD family hydrolase n=1 Tax=uncultured Slackia sp. TaxID=665903 RepID=UPI0025D1E8C0|nr:TatD family hydrolase [uncultured Slackia sp.]